MSNPPTIQDIASALGMHKSTVSLALSGKGTIAAETRKRILAVARDLGYEPNPDAQRLARREGTSLVAIFSGVLDVGLATEKILLIQRALTARSLEVPIYTCCEVPGNDDSGESQATQVRQLCRQRPRAVICAVQRIHSSVLRELEAYQARGGTIISYDTPVPLACDQVIFDREDNAYRAAHHLLEQGHRRIGLAMSFLNGGDFLDARVLENRNDPLSHRLRGFQRALREFGVPFNPQWFFRNTTYETGGAELARQFLEMADRPTAISIVNDYVALAFMVEMMRAGVRIPEDVSVIGHDNQPIAAYCPVPLTSMTQPAGEIAAAVVDLLMGRLNAETPPTSPRQVTITGELIERQSVAPFPEANR